MSQIRLIIFEDLECGDCAVLRRMLDEKILPRFGEKVAFDQRDFPLTKHAWAHRAAIAARYFHEDRPKLGLAWRRFALENRAGITTDNFNERLSAFSSKHGADSAEAVAALDDARLAAAVESDYRAGVALGVSKTPTVFVNGTPFIETFKFEEIAVGIEAALAHR